MQGLKLFWRGRGPPGQRLSVKPFERERLRLVFGKQGNDTRFAFVIAGRRGFAVRLDDAFEGRGKRCREFNLIRYFRKKRL